MTVTESLDALRSQYIDCQTVAFADISTGMILSASSQEHLNQEHLDALCATASEMLSGNTGARISAVLGNASTTEIQQVIIFEAQEVGVFLRSTHSAADALCCACLPSIDLVRFLKDAQTEFLKLEASLIALDRQ